MNLKRQIQWRRDPGSDLKRAIINQPQPLAISHQLFVYDLDLLIDHLPRKPINRHMQQYLFCGRQ